MYVSLKLQRRSKRREMHTKFSLENLKKKDNPHDLDADRRIILK
jgi:hypothetical protein